MAAIPPLAVGASVCVVLQQCVSAKLQLNASDGESPRDPPVYTEVAQLEIASYMELVLLPSPLVQASSLSSSCHCT